MKFLKYRFRSKTTPRKNSKPINILAIKGAISQVINPVSTNLNSSDSIGLSLVIAEIIKMIPQKDVAAAERIFFIFNW